MKALDRTLRCPACNAGLLHFIEVCNEDEVEKKSSYSCDCCDVIVYIVQFEK